jgi:hypothetical protein
MGRYGMCEVVIHIDMSGINAANQSGGVFSAFSAKLKDKIKLVLDKAFQLHHIYFKQLWL